MATRGGVEETRMERRTSLAESASSELADIPAPGREYQELWFALSREPWRMVVLVPADPGVSAIYIAEALGDVARWLREPPATIMTMSDPLDYVEATQLSSRIPPDPGGVSEKVIVAVQPVVVEPLGLAITRTADAVVLCIEKGRSRLASVRRTIELIGRDRIRGCIFVR
jgi:hypothetical protein